MSSIGIGIGIDIGRRWSGVTSPITIDLVASRTSGVAPLAVIFDASGTTCEGVDHPFRELGYLWDFDDDYSTFDGGTIGPVVSHVFDQPGTYSVSVLVVNANGDVKSQGVTITVSDPDTVFAGTLTTCVSTSGTFTGAPSGCTQVTSSDYDAALSTYGGSGKRVLFRRGETFVSSAAATLTNTSEATIGAFGTGTSPDARGIFTNAPVISVMHNGQVHLLGSNPTTCTDLRVMDLSFSYDNGGSPGNLVYLGYRADDLLIYRCNDVASRAFDQNISIGDATPASFGADVCHDVCIANCYWNSGTNNDYGFYGAARGLSLLNTYWGPNQSGSSGHVVRVQFGRGVHIAGNTFAAAASTKHSLTVRALDWIDAPSEDDTDSRYVVCEGNSTNCGTVWAWHIGSESTGHREHVDDVLIFNNHFQIASGGGTGSAYAIHSGGRRVVIANNTTNADSGVGITTVRLLLADTYGSAGQPAPESYVFNNTVYSSIALTGNIRCVSQGSGTCEVRNNLLWGASTVGGGYTVTTGGATFAASNNVSASNPLFVSSSDLHLTASSPAIGAGTQVAACLRDADDVLRGATVDAGAYEFVA